MFQYNLISVQKFSTAATNPGLSHFYTGFAGGIFTSVSGSGLDICSFSILTLLFRVTEKTATPTSVILMAGNTLVGFYWRVVSSSGGNTLVGFYWHVEGVYGGNTLVRFYWRVAGIYDGNTLVSFC